jgi:hypothetical protein
LVSSHRWPLWKAWHYASIIRADQGGRRTPSCGCLGSQFGETMNDQRVVCRCSEAGGCRQSVAGLFPSRKKPPVLLQDAHRNHTYIDIEVHDTLVAFLRQLTSCVPPITSRWYIVAVAPQPARFLWGIITTVDDLSAKYRTKRTSNLLTSCHQLNPTDCPGSPVCPTSCEGEVAVSSEMIKRGLCDAIAMRGRTNPSRCRT